MNTSGFSYHEVEEGGMFRPEDVMYNHLLFLLDGRMQVSCNNFIRKEVQADECVMLPIGADAKCRALSVCRLVCFSFYNLPADYNGVYMADLCRTVAGMEYTFEAIPLREPLQKFLALLLGYFSEGIDSPELQEVKYQEFFLMLQVFYEQQEVAKLLYPLVGNDPSFRLEVLLHCRKVNRVKELAALLNMESRAFGRQMKEEFGLSPYQWLLKQKAGHIYFSLREEKEKSLEAIWHEHGFRYAGHFSRFCKEQFNVPPLKIRNALWRET
ncbi:AraC-like DNA-binding protein [Parabacteroides sp. PF5-5]|uniref:helix-turn-helix domain-containing protein n=1 Tax=unclassified Parabacteroides TaxID=2649774 RepID=UPI0024768C93|nr:MULTISPECIES: helix-turn-helix domain-containing protein [unclassified Parabacteroides]MDH6307062.1 AraC-like DNA-binding protein [Parabacteroides sp. PH5-39]MDH6317278.1 AraC-like DNA-binding protein [Parabacteroides sp. PF5-13]MDH6321718.1 AraC-like DNA-binding protein [Parabacteroides sp. PH5-13]MDH6325450.1 AraC-like DNA-binding protein [Parabacteroides sp. PH5-8]MDH6328548.1 AraC-like DNA-binding protein [Parabacteroides sp. PH5-41]